MFSVIKEERLLLEQEEILCFERSKRSTVIVTTIGVYETWDKLDSIQQSISSDEFVRCHARYLVHLSAVRSLEGNDFWMIDESLVPISRGHIKTVKDKFAAWVRRNVIVVDSADAK